jgi:hypothetical protein
MEKPPDGQPNINLTDPRGKPTFIAVNTAAKVVPEFVVNLLAANATSSMSSWTLVGGFDKQAQAKVAELVEQAVPLLQELSAEKVDPELFDRLLSNQVDRLLKLIFAKLFFWATVAFTVVSYLVIILNSLLNWGIGQIAITALIIETPLQFIGLLYIIARNLFPQPSSRRKTLFAPRHHENGPAA